MKAQWENQDSNDFTSFIEKYLSKEKNLSDATRKKMLRTLNKFRDYAKGEVAFNRLDFKMIDGFNLYLIDKKVAANSRKNEFKFLSKYANIAVRQGLLEYAKNPFKDFSIKREPTNREALNESDLKKIEDLTFTEKNKHLERIRDLFLLQCYTGLRFGDASKIGTSNVFETPDGMEIRIPKSQKTDKPVNLPIHLLFREPGVELSKPEKLLKKYWREDSLPFFLSDKAQQTDAANNQYTNKFFYSKGLITETDFVLNLL